MTTSSGILSQAARATRLSQVFTPSLSNSLSSPPRSPSLFPSQRIPLLPRLPLRQRRSPRRAPNSAQRSWPPASRWGGGELTEVYDAMATAIAWNVNFDPRVSVTCPVSRTFEAAFDFIFFDWDMFFLSLMAGTSPAAENSHAFDIAISNLIETAQTRSAYGHVMNKRAASGSSTSDSNDRSEPFVGAMITVNIKSSPIIYPRVN